MENVRNRPFMLLLIATLVAILAWALNMKHVPSMVLSKTRQANAGVLDIKPDKNVLVDTDESDLEQRILNTLNGNKQSRTNAPLLIRFTQKAACRTNVYYINRAVERWYVLEGEWPSPNLNDRFSRDRDYFPNGIPPCPITGEPYQLDPYTHRVMGHTHDDIPDITDPGDFVGR